MAITFNQELLHHLDLRPLTVGRTQAGKWWNFKRVISPFARLWLILDGKASVRHHGREFQLKPGGIHLVPPFTIHDCSCSRNLDHYYLHFTCRLPTGIDLLALLDHEFQTEASPEARALMQRLEEIYPNRKLPCFDPSMEEYRRESLKAEGMIADVPTADWLEANGIMRVFLALFLRSARDHEGVHARATRQFLALQEFIHANLHRPLLLQDLARVVELHPTYFSDRFRELVGLRPLEYLMMRRMERAQYLLLTTAAPVKQIAAEVGIPDAAYFTRAFKRMCGCPPGNYRLAHKV